MNYLNMGLNSSSATVLPLGKLFKLHEHQILHYQVGVIWLATQGS
jgi:hypothetical protein